MRKNESYAQVFEISKKGQIFTHKCHHIAKNYSLKKSDKGPHNILCIIYCQGMANRTTVMTHIMEDAMIDHTTYSMTT